MHFLEGMQKLDRKDFQCFADFEVFRPTFLIGQQFVHKLDNLFFVVV